MRIECYSLPFVTFTINLKKTFTPIIKKITIERNPLTPDGKDTPNT